MRVVRDVLICILFAAACGSPHDGELLDVDARNEQARKDDGGREKGLERAVAAALDREMAEHPEVRNAVVGVHLPPRDLAARRAAGEADPTTHRSMTPRTPFRIASIAKTMTAVLVMQLIEEGRLALGDTLERLEGIIPVDRIHVVDGVSYGRAITVEQLLRHRSGLPDYFFDGPRDADGLTEYQREMLVNPSVRAPVDLVQWTVDRLQPIAVPGATYHYADTNYLLLGLMVESVERKPLPQAYRDRLFAPLGMTKTYLEFYEPTPRGGQPAHLFILGADVTGVILGEWGGGGIVSTAQDLDRFFWALGEGRLFRSRETLTSMLPRDEIEPGVGYGFGIVRRDLGVEVWGHEGFFGSFAYYVPAARAVVLGTVNQAATDPSRLVTALLAAAIEAAR